MSHTPPVDSEGAGCKHKWVHDNTVNLGMQFFAIILHCEHCGKVKTERILG